MFSSNRALHQAAIGLCTALMVATAAVDGSSSIDKVLDSKNIGDKITVVVLREGKPLQLTLTLTGEKR